MLIRTDLRPLRKIRLSERREIERRKFLAGALVAPIIIGVGASFGENDPLAGAAADDDASAAAVPLLLPHYIYGLVQSVTNSSVTLNAPTSEGTEEVTVQSTPNMILIFNKLSATVSDVPIGSRFEAGTTLIGGNLSNRNAEWMFVNPMYGHGEITSAGSTADNGVTTFQLQQAHDGGIRNLHVSQQAKRFDGVTGADDVPVSTYNVGCMVFYAGIGATPDLATTDIFVVNIARVSPTPLAQ